MFLIIGGEFSFRAPGGDDSPIFRQVLLADNLQRLVGHQIDLCWLSLKDRAEEKGQQDCSNHYSLYSPADQKLPSTSRGVCDSRIDLPGIFSVNDFTAAKCAGLPE